MYVTCRKSGERLALLIGGGACKCSSTDVCAMERDGPLNPIGFRFNTSIGVAEVIGVHGDVRWIKYDGGNYETLTLEHMERRVYHGSLVPMKDQTRG